MGYNIEISFNMQKASNHAELQQNIHDMACNYKCSNFYIFEDADLFSKFKRAHCIIVVNFPRFEFGSFMSFIRNIKKMKQCAIECIHTDDISTKLIYASSYYLTSITKQKAIDYKTYIKEKNFSHEEQALLDVCFKPFHSNNL